MLLCLLIAGCHHGLHHTKGSLPQLSLAPARHGVSGRGLFCLSHAAQVQQPKPEQHVFVGGKVRSPGMVTIPADGRLSLRQALDAAGGLDADVAQSVIAVRRGGPLAHTTYFPLSMVEHDLAGDIPLAHGDEIRVLVWEQTTLVFENSQRIGTTANGDPFLISGWVAQPGVRYIGQPASSLARGAALPVTQDGQAPPMLPLPTITRVADVLVYGGLDGRTQVMILKRRAISGVSDDYFVFPIQDRQLVHDVLAAAPLVSGDEILVGPFSSSPLLMSAVIEPLARARAK